MLLVILTHLSCPAMITNGWYCSLNMSNCDARGWRSK